LFQNVRLTRATLIDVNLLETRVFIKHGSATVKTADENID